MSQNILGMVVDKKVQSLEKELLLTKIKVVAIKTVKLTWALEICPGSQVI